MFGPRALKGRGGPDHPLGGVGRRPGVFMFLGRAGRAPSYKSLQPADALHGASALVKLALDALPGSGGNIRNCL